MSNRRNKNSIFQWFGSDYASFFLLEQEADHPFERDPMSDFATPRRRKPWSDDGFLE